LHPYLLVGLIQLKKILSLEKLPKFLTSQFNPTPFLAFQSFQNLQKPLLDSSHATAPVLDHVPPPVTPQI